MSRTTTASDPTAPGGPSSSTARARDEAARLDEAASLTPTFAQRLRSNRLWLLVGLVAILVVAATVLIQGVSNSAGDRTLDPGNPRPLGAKALAQVLDGHGVEFTIASSLPQVAALSAADARSTTIVLHQSDVYLDSDQVSRLAALGVERLVLIQPGPLQLDALGTGIRSSGNYAAEEFATIEVGAACADPIAENAPTITQLGGTLYEAPAEPGYSNCYPVNDRHAIAIDETGGTAIVALGAARNLTNQHIPFDANAAMAIGLFGDTEHLIWYTPGLEDLEEATGVPPIQALIPSWLTPASLLLFAAGIAAMVWRGRRFGPLVLERLPVEVQASETMEGRARLYARTGSRQRAVDNLRIGTIARLARALGMPPTSNAYEVAIAVAQTIQRPRDSVVAILIEASPANDRELVALSDDLLRIEDACRAALALPADDRTQTPQGAHRPPTRGDS